jgi:hypothetical protein
MSTTSNAAVSAACRYCGNHHGPRCPDVKAIEYHPDGTVKRVEYITAADYAPLPVWPSAAPLGPNLPWTWTCHNDGAVPV